VESGVCVSDTRSCSAPNATAATETWNGSTYIDCTATACASTYHIEFGACVSDTRSCSIANGSGSQNYVSGAWGTCTLVPGSCTTGYHTNGNACEADVIGYCANLSATTTATLGDGPKTIYGELFIANATNAAGAYARSNVKFQYGSGATGSNASGWSNWVDATYDSENGNNDQYRASVAVPSTTGASDYAFRASTNGGTTWTYCMTGNAFSTTYDPAKAGVFTTSGETIDFCNTQFPTTINSSVSTSNTVYGQVYLAGKTNSQGTQYTGNGNPAHQSGNIRMQFGYGLDGSAPSSWATWTSTGVNWNAGSGGNNNDEYQIDWTTPAATGRYDYLFRASGDGGATWTYCDTDGSTTGTGINAPGDNLNTSGTAYTVGYCNIQFPSSVTASVGGSASIYGQLYVAGQTEAGGQAPSSNVVFQFGYGASAASPSTWTNWSSTAFNVQVGNNDEFVKNWSVPLDAIGSKYAFRASGNGGVTWSYCGTGTGATTPNDGTGTAGWGATTITQNLLVQRNGIGSATLSGSAMNVSLLEFAQTGGTVVSTTNLDTSGANQLTDSGSAGSNGYMNTRGPWLSVGGYNTVLATSGVASLNTKVVHLYNGTLGSFTRVLFPTDATVFGGNNFRSSVPVSATQFYATGTGSSTTGGVWYYNGTGFTQISTTVTNLRNVEIYGGNLYYTTGSGSSRGIYQVGTGLPTSSGTTASPLVVTGSSTDPYGFVLFDTNSDTVMDLAYVCDGFAGLQKWTYSSGVWAGTAAWALKIAAGGTALGGTGNGCTGLTGTFASGTATLYFAENITASSGNNRIMKVVDSGTTPTAASVIATAGTNYVFRGVDFKGF
jgi:hypothetical protein